MTIKQTEKRIDKIWKEINADTKLSILISELVELEILLEQENNK